MPIKSKIKQFHCADSCSLFYDHISFHDIVYAISLMYKKQLENLIESKISNVKSHYIWDKQNISKNYGKALQTLPKLGMSACAKLIYITEKHAKKFFF